MSATTVRTLDPVPTRAITTDELDFYREHGYVVLRGLVPAAVARALHDEIMGIMDIIGLPLTKLKQTGEYLRGSLLDGYVNSSAMHQVAAQLLEGDASLYMPFTAVKSPGGGAFSFHQDNQYTRLDGPAINLWVAMMPMGEAEGSLQVLPGSHRTGTLDSKAQDDGSHRMITFEPTDWVQPTLEAGDCIAFTRLTVHGSGANTTDRPRVSYALQYHRNDVRAFFDDRWELLTRRPRWATAPVDAIMPPKGRQDGH